jgi:pilus assembly protein Flp/PilA
MARFLARFRKDCSGATAIEYGLIAFLVAVAIISGASAIGAAVNSTLQTDSAKVAAAGS